ncbi:NAD(P)/FAD-dependent oxidoreductase [Corticimicrobacter populi]|uniref:FAD-dependent oxidoreductase n=1 Tax=Corticimicrobacter populi TaxID=2175229 RepID=A0A2V1JTS2_9BURK|nr:FAD-binding oxidoreductase [Corticimicrobacter populi]PWF21274.1 FAD-dependent oxidoreductase [Corticimicrobacter populi]
MKLEPYWLSTAPAFDASAASDLPAQAECVIVGAGFTGLSAALSLARAGVQVVVLDAGTVIGQASGRNGGHCNTGVAHDFAGLVRSAGLERACSLQRFYTEAVDHVEQLVREENIACDFVRRGKLKLASKARHMQGLEATYVALRRYVSSDVQLFDRAGLRDEIDSEAFHGGLLMPGGAQMHMGRFGMGLAQAAVRQGACVHEQTPVTGLERLEGTRYRVRTSRGTIEAGRVLLATGCSNVGPFAWLQRRIVPVGSFIVVTEPLAPAVIDSLLPQRRTYVTTLNIGNYFRTTEDGRLVFGGRARFALSNPLSDRKSGHILEAGLQRVFPQLAGTRIEYCWGGLVDMTVDRFPRAGLHEGLYFSTGYSGHGTQMSVRMGQVMAEQMLGRPAQHPWQGADQWPAVPGYSGTPWFLPMAGLYYRMKDLFF